MRIIKRKGFPIPSKKAAITIGTWIFVRPNYPDNLLEHEKVHILQFKSQPFTFWARYLLSSDSRFKYEAEAYATSVKFGLDVDLASKYLSEGYNLNISIAEAKDAINSYLNG